MQEGTFFVYYGISLIICLFGGWIIQYIANHVDDRKAGILASFMGFVPAVNLPVAALLIAIGIFLVVGKIAVLPKYFKRDDK